MPGCNHSHSHEAAASAANPGFRKVLWIALIANAAMFFLEIGASWQAGSVSLLADSLDFGGDAANYALSLFVLGMALQTRAKAALLKGVSMGLYGVGVLGFASVIFADAADDLLILGFDAAAADLAVDPLGQIVDFRHHLIDALALGDGGQGHAQQKKPMHLQTHTASIAGHAGRRTLAVTARAAAC